nr:hypothetical protein [Tanacetum cinerariifolium]
MEVVLLESKMESGSEDLGESDDSYTDDEENGVHLVSQPSPTALNDASNERLVATKRNATPDIEDGIAKRSKTTPSTLDIGARLDEINTNGKLKRQGSVGEVAPPQFVSLMRRRRTKMLDTISEDEREFSINDQTSSLAYSAPSHQATSSSAK